MKVCSCGRQPTVGRGLCRRCYCRWWRRQRENPYKALTYTTRYVRNKMYNTRGVTAGDGTTEYWAVKAAYDNACGLEARLRWRKVLNKFHA
jgi:hypothetical protein